MCGQLRGQWELGGLNALAKPPPALPCPLPAPRPRQVADTISDLKLGNGTSVLIFANIASALPSSVGAAFTQVRARPGPPCMGALCWHSTPVQKAAAWRALRALSVVGSLPSLPPFTPHSHPALPFLARAAPAPPGLQDRVLQPGGVRCRDLPDHAGHRLRAGASRQMAEGGALAPAQLRSRRVLHSVKSVRV